MDRFITAKEAMYQTEHSIVFKSKVYKWISEASNKGLCGIRVYTSNYGDSVVNKVFNSLAKDGYHVHMSNYVMYITWYNCESDEEAERRDLYIANYKES